MVSWTTLQARDSGRVQLDYGDALTTNTVQGSTVTEHIHAMPAGSHLVSAFWRLHIGQPPPREKFYRCVRWC
jgi:hypothetical protein